MPKVSVIIPVYNMEKYLRECLDSVINQTLKDIEIICVNDGSTDSSLQILQEYAGKDNRIKIINQANQGQGVARNNGIDFANGEYIVFIDPDDWVETDMLQILYDNFKKTGAEVIQFDLASCRENGQFYSHNSFKKLFKKFFHRKLNNNQIYNWQNIEINNFGNMHLSVLEKAYKTEFIKNNDIKFAPNKNGEDNIFSLKANLLANKILYLNKELYNYRKRTGSTMNSASDENFCAFENIALAEDFLKSKGLYEQYKTAFVNYFYLTYLKGIYECIPEKSKQKYLEKCKEIMPTRDFQMLIKKLETHWSPLEKIFSVKNQKIEGQTKKILTVLGIKIELPKKKGI